MEKIYYWKLNTGENTPVLGPYTKQQVEDHLNKKKTGFFFTLQPISTEEVSVTTTQIKVV